MDMTNRPETGIDYLSLALFARQVIDAVKDSAGGRDKRRGHLLEAIEALEALQAGRLQSRVAALQHYSQVRTLRLGGADLAEILRLLTTLKDQPLNDYDVTRLVEFFFELEKRALANFERPPKEPTPTVILKLCQRLS